MWEPRVGRLLRHGFGEYRAGHVTYRWLKALVQCIAKPVLHYKTLNNSEQAESVAFICNNLRK